MNSLEPSRNSATDLCYRSYTLPNGSVLSIRATQQINPGSHFQLTFSQISVGLVPWPAGFWLAEYILQHPGTFVTVTTSNS